MTTNAPTKHMIHAGKMRGLNTAPRQPLRYNDVEIDIDDDCDAPQDPAPDHVVIPMVPTCDDDGDDDTDPPIPYLPSPRAARALRYAPRETGIPYLVLRHPNGDRWTAPSAR